MGGMEDMYWGGGYRLGQLIWVEWRRSIGSGGSG